LSDYLYIDSGHAASMQNLAQAIERLRNGSLSRDDFLAQLDRALGAGPVNTAELIHTLATENAASPLPADLYMQAQQRIARQAGAASSGVDDETRVLTRRTGQFPAQPPAPPNAATGSPGRAHAPAENALGASEDAERVKGVGDTLNGRFVLEECIGFGGMGTVYKALDLRKLEAADRMPYIAIKVLNVQFRGHPKSLIALQREARKAQALAHPNIVAVYDFDRDGSMVYLTMEYLAGRPLSRVLRAPDFKGMAYLDAMHIVKGMGAALSYAHEHGFVHCDFKPANTILTDSGVVKVIDFGIARVFQKAEADADATVFDPGSLGALTPAYASPEMLEHREPDPRDDIYALACITYELLTGHHPYDRLPANQARNAAIKLAQPTTLTSKQWRGLKAALSLERETRTPTVAQLLKELGGDTLRSPGQAERRSGPPPVLKKVAAGAVLAAAVGGIAWFAMPYLSTLSSQQADAVTPFSAAAIASILSALPCSALLPAIDGRSLTVTGFLSKEVGVPSLKGKLAVFDGVDLSIKVQEVDSDKCGVISLFGPYWIRSRLPGKSATIHASKSNGALTEGEPLMVDVTSPGYDSFLAVDYYILDSNIAHMLPNQRARDNAAPPNHTATIGSLGNWVIGKPFGTELIVLVATPVPLFDAMRPELEPAQDYLRAVATRLAEISKRHGADKVAVDIAQITTSPRPR
jgi:serine/threonine protein kinase